MVMDQESFPFLNTRVCYEMRDREGRRERYRSEGGRKNTLDPICKHLHFRLSELPVPRIDHLSVEILLYSYQLSIEEDHYTFQ